MAGLLLGQLSAGAGPWWGYGTYANFTTAFVALAALFPLLIYRLTTACRDYLHVRQHFAVAFASQIIVLLLLAILYQQEIGWLISRG
jgi:hypothetical protein